MSENFKAVFTNNHSQSYWVTNISSLSEWQLATSKAIARDSVAFKDSLLFLPLSFHIIIILKFSDHHLTKTVKYFDDHYQDHEELLVIFINMAV